MSKKAIQETKKKCNKENCYSLKRIAIKKCQYYHPFDKLVSFLKLSELSQKVYIEKFIRKFNLNYNQLEKYTLTYTFNIGDTIPNTFWSKYIVEYE